MDCSLGEHSGRDGIMDGGVQSREEYYNYGQVDLTSKQEEEIPNQPPSNYEENGTTKERKTCEENRYQVLTPRLPYLTARSSPGVTYKFLSKSVECWGFTHVKKSHTYCLYEKIMLNTFTTPLFTISLRVYSKIGRRRVTCFLSSVRRQH